MSIDTRTDVYALGVILYELLTGCTPLESSTLVLTTLVELSEQLGKLDENQKFRLMRDERASADAKLNDR